MGTLFPSDAEKAFETMALAFSEKNKWDLRWFKMQVIGYTLLGIFLSGFLVSTLEYIFDFSIVGWLFNLG
tara:strand:- start:166 stop:375 length:210 start_codon:yes stop_codon:yes gene_type:complete